MEKKKNTPKLRFPEFTGEWEEKKLGEIAEINPKTNKIPNSFIYIDLESVQSGQLLKEDRVDLVNAPSRAQRVLSKKDVLFQMVRPYQKNNYYFDKDGEYVASTGYAQIRTMNESRYVFQYLHFQKFTDKVIERCKGTSYPAINSTDLSTIEIFIPSKEEQTKIAIFLTAVDEKLTHLKKKITLLEKYKKGVMQKLFSQEFRFKDDNNQDFPDWQELPGNYIFKNVSDKNHISELPILAITQEYGAIPRELIDYNITVTDKSVDSYKVVQIGDFIISLRSFQGGIEYSKYNGICSPAYIILRPIMEIEDCFFKSFFKTELYIKALNKNIEGIRDGKMISYKYFSEINLPYPSLPEQQKIATFLSAIDEKINHCSAQIEKMEAWKKGLLQQMLV
ncbi:restriction endonuclease [Macellibacteroides sp. HH-ZS]|nr:restriction endonuclease [Macellibacteroides sp. HH-ZS]